ncbi:hypothetical protein GCM10020000_43490 [Streptomyces olivoverticillatus]
MRASWAARACSSPPSGSESGQDRQHGKDGKPSRQPDITIPPLLPDILPGLGIHGEEEK